MSLWRKDNMKVVIMAGGKGTRISEMFPDIPKPMIPICGVPVLEREILSLKEQGFIDIILTVGYKAEIIMHHFGDGKKYGVHIEYFVEKEPLGNAGALFQIKDKLTEDFLLLNADAMFNVDFNRFVEFHKEHKGLVTLFTHPNNHPYDSGLIIADNDKQVKQWLSKEDERPEFYQNRVNAGLHVISPVVLDMRVTATKVDLDRQVLKPLCGTGKMYCYDSPEYVRDMGTPDRYESVCKDFEKGIVEARNLKNKQKAIFLDRDGVINKYVGFLRKTEQFELIEGVSKAIKKINQLGYLTVVITNQPVIARGEVTYEKLKEIHNKMETLLGKEGAYLDGIYFCPHHPDSGFKGEIKELKINCDCRKPKPGLLLQAEKDLNIDLKQSWMIGDGKIDILAGKNAGCKTALIGGEDFGQDITVDSLLAFVDKVVGKTMYKEVDEKIMSHIDFLIERYPVLQSCKEDILKAYFLLEEAYRTEHKLLVVGNGGSAADSEHIVGELMKGFKLPRKLDENLKERLLREDEKLGSILAEKLQGTLPAIALDGHLALSTAYMNDCEPLLGFAQQVNGYGKTGDVFLGISTSGNSKNIIYAAITAHAKELKVIGLTGERKSRLSDIADVCIKVPRTEAYMVQELHLPVYHCLCLMLEDRFFGEIS